VWWAFFYARREKQARQGTLGLCPSAVVIRILFDSRTRGMFVL